MKDDTKKTVVKKRAPKQIAPSVRQILAVLNHDDEMIRDVIARVTYKSEFVAKLAEVPIGGGLKIDGDFTRVRQTVLNFGKKHGRKFVVKAVGEDGEIVIARVKDPVTEKNPYPEDPLS